MGHRLKNLQGKTIHGYLIEKCLGHGSFGYVYRASKSYHRTRNIYALKIFDLSRPGSLEDMNDEIAAYKAISSNPSCQKYIVCMYDNFVSKSEGMGGVVLEFMAGGDLNSFVDPGGVSPTDLVILMRDLAAGLAFIHSKDMAHRDIKPGNILASKNDVLFKIADLGGVCGSVLQKCTAFGTPIYLAPEIARRVFRSRGRYEPPITVKQAQMGDIWSLGLVYWVMAFGRRNFPITANGRDVARIILQLSNITKQSQVKSPHYTKYAGSVSTDLINRIIRSMLQVDPKARTSAQLIFDILDQEILGCHIGNKHYIRRDIEDELQSNQEMNKFFKKNNYNPEMLMGDICNLLQMYLNTKMPEPDLMGVEKVPSPEKLIISHKVSDKEILNRAYRNCTNKERIYYCPKSSLDKTYKALKEVGGIPRTLEEHRVLQNYFKLNKDYSHTRACLLCLYLVYRKITMEKGEKDPGLPREIKEDKFACFVNNKKRDLPEMHSLARMLKIPSKGVPRSKLCYRIYRSLIGAHKISKRQVAQDIYDGIEIATKDDIDSGIYDLDIKQMGKVSQEQREVIETIVSIARNSDNNIVDINFLKERLKSIHKDLQSLKLQTNLNREQKIRQLYNKRIIMYLDHTIRLLQKKK